MTRISNAQDLIDSREVIERIEELRAMLPEEAGDVMPGTSGDLEDIQAELEALEALAEEGEQYAPDWLCGETLIHSDYFQTYAQELAEDCGLIRKDANWPNNCIDWEEAARQLQQDYTPINFAGQTYWIR